MNKQLQKNLEKNQSVQIIFGSLVILWLVLLTLFTLWAWNQHIWQAKADNETIYQLLVDNAKQQEKIDELSK
jgi:hypothetical protein